MLLGAPHVVALNPQLLGTLSGASAAPCAVEFLRTSPIFHEGGYLLVCQINRELVGAQLAWDNEQHKLHLLVSAMVSPPWRVSSLSVLPLLYACNIDECIYSITHLAGCMIARSRKCLGVLLT